MWSAAPPPGAPAARVRPAGRRPPPRSRPGRAGRRGAWRTAKRTGTPGAAARPGRAPRAASSPDARSRRPVRCSAVCTPVATALGCARNWLTCQAAIPAVLTRATVTTMAVIVMRWPDHAGRRLLPGAARRDAVAGAAPGIPSACGWPMGDTVSSQVAGEVTGVAPVPASGPAGARRGPRVGHFVARPGITDLEPGGLTAAGRGQLRGQPGLRHAGCRRGLHAGRGLSDGHAARRAGLGHPQTQRRALEWPALARRRAGPGRVRLRRGDLCSAASAIAGRLADRYPAVRAEPHVVLPLARSSLRLLWPLWCGLGRFRNTRRRPVSGP